MNAALDSARQVPDNPAVHIAKIQFALLGLLSGARNVVKNPFDLGAGEVRGQGESHFGTKAILSTDFCQFIADEVSTCVLPYDSIVDRLASVLVPDHRGLTLVGDADCCEILSIDMCFCKCTSYNRLNGCPDFHCIMFDPAGLGENLLMFFLIDTDNLSSMVEDHEPGAGRTLIYCSYIFCHDDFSFVNYS